MSSRNVILGCLLAIAVAGTVVFSPPSNAVQVATPVLPPGPPATLAPFKCDARTGISSLPFVITAPGSYYLAGDLTGVSSSSGISVQASDVTIDLNGFTLRGVPGSLDGIEVVGPQQNLHIFGGVITTWGQDGINAAQASSSRFSDIRSSENARYGLQAGSWNELTQVNAHSNGGGESFMVTGGFRSGVGCIIRECLAQANLGIGFQTDQSSNIAGSIARENTSHGFLTEAKCLVSGCTADNNGDGTSGIGFWIGFSSRISGCTTARNSGNGIEIMGSGTVSDCVSSNNGGTGIVSTGSSLIEGCRSHANGTSGSGHGISTQGAGNTIQANFCSVNAQNGVFLNSDNNVVVKNVLTGNANGVVDNGINNSVGPVNFLPQSVSPYPSPSANFVK